MKSTGTNGTSRLAGQGNVGHCIIFPNRLKKAENIPGGKKRIKGGESMASTVWTGRGQRGGRVGGRKGEMKKTNAGRRGHRAMFWTIAESRRGGVPKIRKDE